MSAPTARIDFSAQAFDWARAAYGLIAESQLSVKVVSNTARHGIFTGRLMQVSDPYDTDDGQFRLTFHPWDERARNFDADREIVLEPYTEIVRIEVI